MAVGEIDSDSALALIVGEASSSASNSALSRSAGSSLAREVFSSSAERSAREKVGRASSAARASWKLFVKRSKSKAVCIRTGMYLRGGWSCGSGFTFVGIKTELEKFEIIHEGCQFAWELCDVRGLVGYRGRSLKA